MKELGGKEETRRIEKKGGDKAAIKAAGVWCRYVGAWKSLNCRVTGERKASEMAVIDIGLLNSKEREWSSKKEEGYLRCFGVPDADVISDIIRNAILIFILRIYQVF